MPTLGEKLRLARKERGMTQKELAGETITRTMLSQIESDSALPSLPTICELAARLGIPVGYFLSDGEEAQHYLDWGRTARARELFRAGNYEEVIREAGTLADGDGEKTLLLSASCYRLGRGMMQEGKLKSARGMFLRCQNAVQRTGLPSPYERPAAVCLDFIRRLTDPEQKRLPFPLFSDPASDPGRLTLLQKIRDLTDDGLTAAARELMKRTEKTLPEEKLYLEALLSFKEGDYASAIAKCEALLRLEPDVPARVTVLSLEETAAAAAEDFRTAYRCTSRRQKLEKMFHT